MKKLLFSSLLTLGLLFPASFSAIPKSSVSKIELSTKKPKKKKSKKKKKGKLGNIRSYFSQDGGCTYNGHQLIVGERGGCYYYSGSSKQYVDRSYCSGCR